MASRVLKSHTASLLVAMALLLLLLLGYYPTLRYVLEVWGGRVGSEGYTHGFLVLGCALYLLYARRDQLATAVPRPNPWGLIPLAGASLLWFLAMTVDVQMLQLALLPVLLLSSVWTVYGNAVLRIACVPIALLFFALPIWQPLLPLLQDITTAVSHALIKAMGKPIYVVGNYVYMSGGAFVIEEACSGLRFLLVGTILTLVNSHLNRHTLRQGAFLLLVITLLAFVANWVRVVSVILIGDATQMQSPLVEDHANFGWFIFLIFTLLPYILISRKVIPPEQRSRPPSEGGQAGNLVAGSLLAGGLLLVGPLLALLLNHPDSRMLATDQLPSTQGGWQRLQSSTVDWRPQFLGGSESLSIPYRNGRGEEVELHIVYYGRQEQGAELINAENQLTDGVQWQAVPGSDGRATLPDSVDGLRNVHVLDINSGRARKRIWYWYNVGGVNTSSRYGAKLLQVRSVLDRRADAALVALAVTCPGACEDAPAVLQDFLLAHYSSLRNVLASASQ